MVGRTKLKITELEQNSNKLGRKEYVANNYSSMEERINRFKKLNLNSNDFIILFISSHKPSSITDIQKIIGISYKNLLPHINKLEKNNLIKIKNHGKGKIKEVTIASEKFNVLNFFCSF